MLYNSRTGFAALAFSRKSYQVLVKRADLPLLMGSGIAMWLRTSCLLEFNPSVATPFLLMLRPRSGWQQWVGREQYLLSPSVPVVEFTDPFGNLCQRLVAPPGPFSIRTSADIESADTSDTAPGASFVEVQELPRRDAPLPAAESVLRIGSLHAHGVVARRASGGRIRSVLGDRRLHPPVDPVRPRFGPADYQCHRS